MPVTFRPGRVITCAWLHLRQRPAKAMTMNPLILLSQPWLLSYLYIGI